MKHPRLHDEGFSLIEVAIATSLVVLFFMAFAMSLDASTNNVRDNRNRTSATGVVSESIEFARSLEWDELAMSSIDASAPMLDSQGTGLDGSEAGLPSDELFVVDAVDGSISPKTETQVEETTYTSWRYVTDAGSGLRRVVVLVVWNQQGQQRSLQSTTLISQVTADGSVAIGGTTTTSGTTTTTAATTTTVGGVELVVYKLKLTLDEDDEESVGKVTVKDENGDKIEGVTVHVRWSVDPSESGYPFTDSGVTDNKGEVELVLLDSFEDDTEITFCVTDLVLSGHYYDSGDECENKEWDD